MFEDQATDAERSVGRSRVRWVVAGFLVSLFFLFGWFDQSVSTTTELGVPDKVRVEAEAGPIQVTVSADDQVRLHRQESWLFSEPFYEQESSGGEVVVRSACPGLFPCRSALRLEVPAGMVVEVVAEDGVVDLVSFDGDITVQSSSPEGVVLGSVIGTVTVRASAGHVMGRQLQVSDLTVDAGDGEVDLVFSRAPTSLSIQATDAAVRVLVPDLLYRLDIATSSEEVEIDVDRATAAPRDINISSTGPVTLGLAR